MDVALKEWAVVVEALACGRQCLLLRKGGIVEGRRGFEVRHPAFLFFPGIEHQHESFIRDEEKGLFARARALYDPGRLQVRIYADVVDVFTAPDDPARLLSATQLHIWNERYIQQRYEYRPDLPLCVLLLRAQRLPHLVELPMRSSYAGCKSWVNLTEDVDVTGAAPVLSDDAFAAVRAAVIDSLALNAAQPRL